VSSKATSGIDGEPVEPACEPEAQRVHLNAVVRRRELRGIGVPPVKCAHDRPPAATIIPAFKIDNPTR
jgi:hypothetical protein